MAVDVISTLNKNGSGLNIKDLTTVLVQSEVLPAQTTYQNKVTQTNASISALGELRAGFDKLSTAVDVLRQSPVLTATSTNSGVGVNFTDREALVEGEVELNVLSLAKRQVLEFGGFSGPDATIGSGTIAIDFGVWADPDNGDFVADPSRGTQQLSFLPGATLQEIADQLNLIDGVSARLLDKGNGTYSLGIASEQGAGNALRFSVTENALDPGLSALDTQYTVSNVTIQEASDALLQVDGVAVLRPSNSIDDLVKGATVELTGTGPATITIARDAETAATNLEFLATALNDALTMLGAMTDRGIASGTRGALAGDVTTQALREGLRSLVSAPITGHSDRPAFLSDMGLAIQRDGTFAFDRDQFDRAFAQSRTMFDSAFTDTFKSDTPGFTLTGMPPATTASGTYSFLRTNGSALATIGGKLTIGAANGMGQTDFVPLTGSLAGVKFTVEDGIGTANVRYGQSFLSMLDGFLAEATKDGGSIATREERLAENLTEYEDELRTLDKKEANLTDRYMIQFGQMETIVTQLKSTGSYLTSLMDAWNKDY